MHPLLDDWIKTVGATSEERQFFADIRALLKKFVTGGDFDDDVLFKELRGGRQLWSVRITFHPQERIIGAFLRKGELIGLTHRSRDSLGTEGFVPTITRAQTIWDSVFPGFGRITGNRTDLLSDFDHDG